MQKYLFKKPKSKTNFTQKPSRNNNNNNPIIIVVNEYDNFSNGKEVYVQTEDPRLSNNTERQRSTSSAPKKPAIAIDEAPIIPGMQSGNPNQFFSTAKRNSTQKDGALRSTVLTNRDDEQLVLSKQLTTKEEVLARLSKLDPAKMVLNLKLDLEDAERELDLQLKNQALQKALHEFNSIDYSELNSQLQQYRQLSNSTAKIPYRQQHVLPNQQGNPFQLFHQNTQFQPPQSNSQDPSIEQINEAAQALMGMDNLFFY